MQKNYYAIIDVGSNTMRLVIYAQEKAGRLREVQNVKAVARLRNHLDQDAKLTETGQRILLDTLHSFSDVMQTYELTNFVCVATATIRQAANQNEIKQLVQEHLQWNMRILSEHEEAFYGYLAVVNSTSIKEGITIDIGGGSTEVTYFKDRQLIHAHSFPFGALTLRSFIDEEGSMPYKIKHLRKYLFEQFKSLPWLKQKNVPLIGIGGSARNLVQIDQNQKAYPLAGLHQYNMQDDDIVGISNYLAALPSYKLQKVEGLSKDRADIILPAIEAFYCLYQTIEATSFVLSRKGLRDGVFYELLSPNQQDPLFPNVLEDSIQELITDYDLNLKQILHVQYLTRKLFQCLKESGLASVNSNDWMLIKRGCYVFNLGEYIDSESSAQHTFYLLANRTIDGLMHMDRLRLALIASFKNKTVFKQFIKPYKEWFLKQERKKLRLLGSLLKFTYCLDATKRQVVSDFSFEVKGDTIYLKLYCQKNWMPEAYQSEKQKKHLEKTLKKNIELEFVDHSVIRKY
ncbi:exopolyphosphatase [Paraliobacillus ryukyuensis]|uniref:Exopolyphosphatase/guanosine-5'-triphosphate, 3'-diphosphate pyrophosphatase n=1 Tax=Paraliobacillus ryukyuensis TaxID=200904 RepID=A0A366DZ36_9BACI|nr:Ppx/GppA family phosphatase [Paraliobacillus ryukyuensis]RBO95366.1 exopolyphosphatase/guanosine-5'-triphosphate,3'-diphosphate pyrophosphatase [Paraliobacillus ryukyuensis]